MISLHYRRILFTSLLAILLLYLRVPGAAAQSNSKRTSAASTVAAAQHADGAPNPTPTSPPGQGELKFVVALFRHGVRAPLGEFNSKAREHSQKDWPTIEDWGLSDKQWGFLTPHGATAVKVLGGCYGSYYKTVWPSGFKAYLWADSQDERTLATAAALREGMERRDIDVTIESLPAGATDPLFHPFTAMCGTPEPTELQRIVEHIKAKCPEWLDSFKDQLNNLDDLLACKNECGRKPCEPLSCVNCFKSPAPTPTPTPTTRPSSPIKWDGRFSYASSATEAFLLEYANGMPTDKIGWGNVIDKQTGSIDKLCKLLELHEVYFEQTQREQYLAGIEGANLVREILDQLNRKAGYKSPVEGKCPRANADSKFVGLVGHDTNLANVQTLLKVKWNFEKDQQLPAGSRSVPDNDALPAGALVFELRQRGADYRVDIEYVTQSLDQMRDAPGSCKPFDPEPCPDGCKPYRLQTTCGGAGPCEMSLRDFNKLAGEVITKYGIFLSKCQNGRQTCP